MEIFITADGVIGNDVPPGADPRGELILSSTGGFSNVFALPSYQASAVTEYLDKYTSDYPGQYNNSGTVRGELTISLSPTATRNNVLSRHVLDMRLGFPNIASNGAWFSVAVFGELTQIFGTSCSAPAIAALLALINGERIKAGKSSVGFINPTLYAHPEVLHDITGGANPVSSTTFHSGC